MTTAFIEYQLIAKQNNDNKYLSKKENTWSYGF